MADCGGRRRSQRHPLLHSALRPTPDSWLGPAAFEMTGCAGFRVRPCAKGKPLLAGGCGAQGPGRRRIPASAARSKDAENRPRWWFRLAHERVLWKTPDFRFLNQKALASGVWQAYIASSRRPDGLFRGPRNGPEAKSSALFPGFFVVLEALKKVRKRVLTGKQAGAYTPRLIANGAADEATTDAADSRSKPLWFWPFVRGMFDIVSGRETRAAVLLAGFSKASA